MPTYQIPSQYNAWINQAAAANNLNPDYLRGIIGQESSFNPNAVSATGAQGLGQILPSTAANPGYGVTPLANPFDAQSNIQFAASYLSARGSAGAYSGNSYQSVPFVREDGTTYDGQGAYTAPAGSAAPAYGGDPYVGPNSGVNTSAEPPDIPVNSPSNINPDGTVNPNPGLGSSSRFGTDGSVTPIVPSTSTSTGTSSTKSSTSDSWFRRGALAVLGVIMLTVAFVSLSRGVEASAIRKAITP